MRTADVQKLLKEIPLSRAAIAREIGVSRTYITLLAQRKRIPSVNIVGKLTQLKSTVGKTPYNDNQPSFDTQAAHRYNILRGPLAQLEEQLTLNQPVGGSSPPRLTLEIRFF